VQKSSLYSLLFKKLPGKISKASVLALWNLPWELLWLMKYSDAEEINFHVEQIVLDVEEIITHAE